MLTYKFVSSRHAPLFLPAFVPCNFLKTKILQSKVATRLRFGGNLMKNLLQIFFECVDNFFLEIGRCLAKTRTRIIMLHDLVVQLTVAGLPWG